MPVHAVGIPMIVIAALALGVAAANAKLNALAVFHEQPVVQRHRIAAGTIFRSVDRGPVDGHQPPGRARAPSSTGRR